MTGHVPESLEVFLPDAEATIEFGRRIASHLRAGDLVVLTGDLGAGKTTLTRGIGEGLRVRGAVTSPTFVLSRLHPPLIEGPSLLHVDAYRLSSSFELDDLDLAVEDSVTVVEWGRGVVEHLAESRCEIDLTTAEPGRTALVRTFGSRWSGTDLADVVNQRDS